MCLWISISRLEEFETMNWTEKTALAACLSWQYKAKINFLGTACQHCHLRRAFAQTEAQVWVTNNQTGFYNTWPHLWLMVIISSGTPLFLFIQCCWVLWIWGTEGIVCALSAKNCIINTRIAAEFPPLPPDVFAVCGHSRKCLSIMEACLGQVGCRPGLSF